MVFIGITTTFGTYGNLTDDQQYTNFKEIRDGKYSNLTNLIAKDYDNQNNTNGFVGYAFPDWNDIRYVHLQDKKEIK